jgi:putative ABC transport system substrate-binding protein
MKRREFITLLGGAAGVLPLPLRAQQKAMPVVGYLSSRSPPPNLGDFTHGPVHQGLGETGFVEGQNMMSEYRFAEDDYDRLPALAADLVGRKVDLIFTDAGTPPALAAQPRQSRSYSSTSATRSGSASSPVSPGRGATSRASPISSPS